jgi:hypothetical protein
MVGIAERLLVQRQLRPDAMAPADRSVSAAGEAEDVPRQTVAVSDNEAVRRLFVHCELATRYELG